MQIIGTTTKVAALAALLALANFLPANAAAPASLGHLHTLASATDVEAPSDDQVVELADRSMRVFMASVREKSMQGLWNHVSPRFKEQFSVAQLDQVFKPFYNLAIVGDPLAGKSPIFAADPTIDANSNLIVEGYYTTSPLRVSFHLVFAMEGRTWKLVSINVSAKPTGTSSASQSSVPGDRDAHRYRAL